MHFLAHLGQVPLCLIQFLGVWVESTRWARPLLRAHPLSGRLWTALVLVAPLPLLVSAAVLEQVIAPIFVALGYPGITEAASSGR